MAIDTLFRSTSGNLYAGTDDGDGKFSGRQVKDGKLSGALRTGINGSPVAKIVGDPLEGANDTSLPRDCTVCLEGNPAGAILLGQLLDADTKANTAQKTGNQS